MAKKPPPLDKRIIDTIKEGTMFVPLFFSVSMEFLKQSAEQMDDKALSAHFGNLLGAQQIRKEINRIYSILHDNETAK